jgi:hypothetical protein
MYDADVLKIVHEQSSLRDGIRLISRIRWAQI